jgi:hypothetical protein
MLHTRSGAVAASLFILCVLTGCNGAAAIPRSASSLPLQRQIDDDAHRKNPCAKNVCIYVGN